MSGFDYMPFAPSSHGCYVYRLVLLGKLICHAFVYFFIEERRDDFADFCKNNVAHLSLAFGYLMSNMIPIGTLIAFLHEVSDIWLHVAKIAEANGHQTCAIIGFILAQIVWLACRLIALLRLLLEIRKLHYEPDQAHL